MDDAELEAMIGRLAAETATPDEERAIRAHVEAAPGGASSVSRQLLIHRMLGQLGRPRTDAARLIASLPRGESASAKVMPTIASIGTRRSRRWPVAVAVGLILAAAGVALWVPQRRQDEERGGLTAARRPALPAIERGASLPPLREPLPVLEAVSGDVFIVEHARRRAAGRDEVVAEDAGVLAATPFSSATLRFADSTRVVLSGSGVLGAVSAAGAGERGGKQLFLAHGRLTATVPRQPADRPFLVTTPHAEVIVLGTHVRLDVSADGTRVSAGEGRLRVRGGARQPPVEIEANQFALVRAGAAPVVGDEAMRGVVLFVAANPPELFGGDDLLIARLRTIGFDVRTVSGSDPSLLEEARASRLVAISASVTSADFNAPLRELAVPLVVWEPQLFDDLGMTRGCDEGDCGEERGAHPAVIKQQAHPLAAGLTGTVPVLRVGAGMTSWGIPGLHAHWIATLAANPQKAMVFAYDAGTEMPGGVAPARRVALFLNVDSPGVLTDAGWRLFEAAITWATDPTAAR